MQNKERTLTNLLNLDRRVWLYIQNKVVWEIFCNQAEKEGFMWADGRKMKFVEFDNIVALNNDLSFNYVGFVGHIWFANSEDTTHYKIDFAKYINGVDDYFVTDHRYMDQYISTDRNDGANNPRHSKNETHSKMTKVEIKKHLTEREGKYRMFEDD